MRRAYGIPGAILIGSCWFGSAQAQVCQEDYDRCKAQYDRGTADGSIDDFLSSYMTQCLGRNPAFNPIVSCQQASPPQAIQQAPRIARPAAPAKQPTPKSSVAQGSAKQANPPTPQPAQRTPTNVPEISALKPGTY